MLTDTAIRSVKPSQKPQKLFDEKGLFLAVTPSGGRLWRFKYRFPKSGPTRKEMLLALGSYPEISLKQARERRDDARRDIGNGIDPALRRRSERQISVNTFKSVALELFALLRQASVTSDNPQGAAGEVVERTIQAPSQAQSAAS